MNLPRLHEHDPLRRFTGLAALYARCRPGYPEAAVDFIYRECGLSGGALLVDVGSGTGIAARQFAQRGVRVVGVEPNDDMRAQAEAEPPPDGCPPPHYQAGRAEETGLADGCADAVLAAQAFHWFEPEAALREFHRILRPNGGVALMWNERDERDPFTAAYGEVIRSTPRAAAIERSRRRGGEALLASPLFAAARRIVFPNEQPLGEDEMIGRALSASYAPRVPEEVARFTARLQEVFARFQRGGRVTLRYETSVYLARKPGETCSAARRLIT